MDTKVSNYRTTTVQHTCLNQGNDASILANGPFICDSFHYDSHHNKIYPYCGQGIYFWDNNIKMAHSYGKDRYKNSPGYAIMEGSFILNDDVMLDLVGSREDLMFLEEQIKALKEKKKLIGNSWNVGEAITFARLSYKLRKISFPYQFVRIEDVYRSKRYVKFHQRTEHGTYLDPCIMICVFERSNHLYNDMKIIYRSENKKHTTK